ncbi:MAG: TIR domain-containing protein [Alphaproteobacteria bacterium]|nr:TIR domain-containing protein [Alphaproteobacteria bacterium]
MADVFISYAREDRDRAREIAGLIETQGFEVWWDRDLLPGETYAEAIENELDQAHAVIVLWSEHSRRSHWVRDEAAVGRDRNRLIPITVDASTPPLGFRQIHTVSAAALSADARTRDVFFSSLTSLRGDSAAPLPPERAAPQTTPGAVLAGVTAAPNNKPLQKILKEEKRQRGFMRTFWLTSFVVSAVFALVYGVIFGETPANAEYGADVVAIGAFLIVGVGLIIGRFFIVIGRRLSKRKSVRYFDGPTIIILLVSFAFGALVGLGQPPGTDMADRVGLIALTAALLFPFVAVFSIPIGFFRGVGRKTFEDGR